MKRIVLLVGGLLLAAFNSAEAWTTPATGRTYTQPARATYTTRPAQPARTTTNYSTRPAAQPVRATTANYSTRPATQPVRATTVSYSPSTAQGVANIMASTNRVGHFGGNTGYEGCGAGGSAAAAYNNCCFANSGMRTVDVGYARSANGMWYCCRRYR